MDNSDILSRFEKLLFFYYDSEKQLEKGIPSVQYCTDELFMSQNYFGDLVKKETGETASTHIRNFIIEIGKSKLMEGKPITQIAFELGFEYPQHFSRLFKKQTGITPSQYFEKMRR